MYYVITNLAARSDRIIDLVFTCDTLERAQIIKRGLQNINMQYVKVQKSCPRVRSKYLPLFVDYAQNLDLLMKSNSGK